MTKAYLGDGAYAEWDGYAVTLTAENGIVATDTVVLEPEVLVSLMGFIHHKTDPKLVAALRRVLEGGEL